MQRTGRAERKLVRQKRSCYLRSWTWNLNFTQATEIPDEQKVDLIMVGATGLRRFWVYCRSSSEYILRHAKVDLPVVRDSENL